LDSKYRITEFKEPEDEEKEEEGEEEEEELVECDEPYCLIALMHNDNAAGPGMSSLINKGTWHAHDMFTTYHLKTRMTCHMLHCYRFVPIPAFSISCCSVSLKPIRSCGLSPKMIHEATNQHHANTIATS
jgi:hypothetical protein